ncbi:LysR family transcriptional regulator|uniref:DNA-binding transcriptional regulator, LysR family n=1 Tax=Dendrosporobacter quercicolus TaxID=146817 RepID=A0A1G9RT30_9FIRM|nr:LysR family transcriptional regulator [Dendrosporobacter quercicolus]NSL49356.1 LysR family transcriptional regulator [Dendrosporobacter quercicolus DSM 1736]SDM26386.1 DNA-binding transcriptional regulator, LysR family [Dendrosporobacter quercicolus]
MDRRDWIILKTIAEEKNMTKAAERLYISQPALSYRLKNMEKKLGAAILIRTANGVSLTQQGEYLLEYVNDMLRQFTRLKETIQNMGGKVQGMLRLGSSTVIAHYKLPAILKEFLDLYPEVEVSLKTGMSQKIYRLLQKDEISVAILRGDFSWDEEKHLLANEPICLVSSQSLKLADLPRRPGLVAQTDASLQAIFHEWWRQNFDRPPMVTMELDSMETCRQMVCQGLGWAIMPAIGISSHHELHRQPLYWKNGQPLCRPTWLLCHRSALELSAVQAFVEFVQTAFQAEADIFEKNVSPTPSP